MGTMKKRTCKLSAQLRQAIVDSGKSLGQLTRETGIDKSALSRFVNGERGVSMNSWDALGECLGLRLVADKPRRRKGR